MKFFFGGCMLLLPTGAARHAGRAPIYAAASVKLQGSVGG